MGRGRQKAKHTKVARDLKYFSPDTNYGALERELSTSQERASHDIHADEWPEYEDTYGAGEDDTDSDAAEVQQNKSA